MYKLIHDTFTGKLNCITKMGEYIPICEDNSDYQEFKTWNKAQKTPLDLNSTIEVVKPEPVRDLAKEITIIQERLSKIERK